MKKILALTLTSFTLIVSGCSGSSDNANHDNSKPTSAIKDDKCTPVVVATSSEKINLMSELGENFKKSSQFKSLKTCATVYPINVTSGEASKNLTNSLDTWPTENKELWPTVWSPASTIWTDRVTAVKGSNSLENIKSFAKSPVVLGMPESMSKALGYPQKQVSLNSIEKIIASKDGWGSVGKPIWGNFKIAKTNPNTSTSGLETILMQSYAANNKTSGLTTDDVTKAKDFNKTFESSAIHYGDTTGNVLETLYKNSSEGNSNYVSAIAMEETSLINYNKGNPDSHTVQPGETLTPPKEKLIAVYPSGGSIYSDNPTSTINAKWVTPAQKEASAKFEEYLQTKEAQESLSKYGFRSINKSVDNSKDFNDSNGTNSTPPKELSKPATDVVASALDQWESTRKPSAVLELIDMSGSMRDDAGNGKSKLTAAIESMQGTLSTYRNTDNVGVWGFTTNTTGKYGDNIIPVREFGALNGQRETLKGNIGDIVNANLQGTPLYDSISTAYDYMLKKAEPGRVNAIVLLTDGQDTDSNMSLDSLIIKLKKSAHEGESSNPVRIFTIAYGDSADKNVLKSIAEATGGQMFDSSDPSRINQVFSSVMNNF